MPNHAQIYDEEAATYELLISKQPSLAPTIERIRLYHGLDIVDLGAGTGRLTTVLAPHARSIVAVDASQAMLDVTAQKLQQAGLTNWRTVAADHRSLPLPAQSADLLVAGWTISYVANDHVADRKENLRTIFAEMKRILRPGGTLVLLETMGTGTETPNPPSFLQGYYEALIEEYGCTHEWMRLDYTFDHIDQAERLTTFFFGDALGQRVRSNNWTRVPECAGIWWLHTSPSIS